MYALISLTIYRFSEHDCHRCDFRLAFNDNEHDYNSNDNCMNNVWKIEIFYHYAHSKTHCNTASEDYFVHETFKVKSRFEFYWRESRILDISHYLYLFLYGRMSWQRNHMNNLFYKSMKGFGSRLWCHTSSVSGFQVVEQNITKAKL